MKTLKIIDLSVATFWKFPILVKVSDWFTLGTYRKPLKIEVTLGVFNNSRELTDR